MEKEMEESLKAKLSAWAQRVAEADSVTLHPWDMGRYDRGGGGRVYMQEREREKRNVMEKQADIERKKDNAQCDTR